ncbi:MAG: mannosyl-3-phosphoglycerate synthase [Saprospiraceae bacterium]|nr:mannosyl-3-phosphoglycerate synthase [Saprospiraceae bacterium]
MRLELPRHAERFGANIIHDIQKVYELDAGNVIDQQFSDPFHVVQQVSAEQLHEVESQMAIIIPVKNERLRLLEGILYGIPHYCLPIIVSNSSRNEIDRFRLEQNVVENYCRFAKKNYLLVHQKDPVLALAFEKAGYPHMHDEAGLLRNGKAEGMLLGIALARAMGKKYVGFIDADNYFPGGVFEYVRIYSATMAKAGSDYAMTRILWHSKPKIVDDQLFFAKYGRVSRITNNYLNLFASQHTGFETSILKTGNAGEHALSMPLALELDYSAGFSVETYHFINMFEKFGGILPCPCPDVMKSGVHIYQVESRNPHLHEAKGDEHLHEMIEYSLAVIYHSPLCMPALKQEILEELHRQKILELGQEPLRPRIYPSLKTIDWNIFSGHLDFSDISNVQHTFIQN